MTEYADLCVKIPLKNRETWGQFLRVTLELGYSCIAVPFEPPLKGLFSELRKLFEGEGVEVVSRLDLSPTSPQELLRKLRKHRWDYAVIAVKSSSKAVLRQAAKDRRVDLITIPFEVGPELFGKHERALLLSSRFKAYEITFSDLSRFSDNEDFLFRLRQELSSSFAKVPIVISSGASSPWDMRDPILLASLITFLLGEKNLLKAPVSTYPLTIVRRNLAKLTGGVPIDGVRKAG